MYNEEIDSILYPSFDGGGGISVRLIEEFFNSLESIPIFTTVEL